jgi:hypothetical protein
MFALTFLGTSASVPSAERNHPGLLIEAGSQRILVDCGEGTQRQLLRGGAGFRRLDRLQLTHGHFDHVLGIPGFFSTLRLRGSADLMTIHGSPGTLDVVVRMLAGLWGEGKAPIPLKLVPLVEGEVIDAGEFTIGCFPVRHRETDSFGFSFESRARRHLRPDRLEVLGVPDGFLRGELAQARSLLRLQRLSCRHGRDDIHPGLTFDAVGNPGEIIAALDCDTEDGMGNCPVDVTLAAETPATETTVADAFDPAVLELAAEPAADTAEPTIRSVDAIIAEVHQIAVIVVPGDTETAIEPAQTATIALPAAEPTIEDKVTSDASAPQPNEEKAGEASAAIVVEVTDSATVAIPGQPVNREPVVTGSVTEPPSTTPVSMLDGKNCDEDF